jgi:AhpD family alkylhydroperoxidase
MTVQSVLEEFPTPSGLDLPRPEGLMSLLSQVEPIAGPWSRFAKALMSEGRLRPSWRELVILRVASRRSCPYALESHRLVGRHTGLSEARMAMAMANNRRKGLGSVDELLILATDELLDEGRISVSTKKTLHEFFDNPAIVELAMLVGQYVLVGMVCETFELTPESQSCIRIR